MAILPRSHSAQAVRQRVTAIKAAKKSGYETSSKARLAAKMNVKKSDKKDKDTRGETTKSKLKKKINFNKVLGIPTAMAQTVESSYRPQTKSTLERAVEVATDPLGLQPRIRGLMEGTGGKVYASEGQDESMVFDSGEKVSEWADKPYVPDEPTGQGENGDLYFNNFDPAKDGPLPSGYRGFISQEPAAPAPYKAPEVKKEEPVYDVPEERKTKSPYKVDQNMFQPADNGMFYGAELPPAPEPQITNPENIQTSYRTVKSDYGSGSYGTGKGGYNDGTSEYIDALQDSLGGYGDQRKDVLKQIADLIKQLDPTYESYQTTATNELNKSRQEDINKLAGLFAAYGTPDSEQRAQAQERVMADYGNKLAELLSKLTMQKQQDVTGYKNKGVEMTNQISREENSARQNVAQMIYQAKQAAAQRAQEQMMQMQQAQRSTRRGGSPTKSTKIGRNDIFDWTQDALSKGYGWAEIADAAKQVGIDTYTGGYFDQLMRNAFPQ